MSLFDVAVPADVSVWLSALDAWNEQELKRQREVVRARRYHYGDQGARLTERLKEFLSDGDDPFRLNVCANVVTAVSERLCVSGFDCADMTLLEWVQTMWRLDNIDAKQEEIHEGALRDGEYFAIIDWDTYEQRPTLIPYERYTSIEAGGNGQGCIIYYEEDDYNQRPQVAIKQWVEATARDIVERRNLYYPDRIEKWVRDHRGEWMLLENIDWTDAEGAPLGIAVVHFRNKGLRPAAADAMPLQRAVNKSLLDLLASSDLTAFRIFVSLGFIPTSDGGPLKADRSNLLQIEPGQVVGTTLPPNQAEFSAINPAELNPQLDLTHQLILWLATTTNTPVSRFISTKLIASDETLKEQEGPLLSRIRGYQTSFGNAWVRCMQMFVKLQNTFGDSATLLNEDLVLDPLWIEPQSRSQQERLDLLLKKKALGIPREQLWREAGYSSQRIRLMEEMLRNESMEVTNVQRNEGQTA